MQKINTTVMMSGADYFDDTYAINAHMDDQVPVDKLKALQEHAEIRECFEKAGINVVKVDAPSSSQDGVYTANWAVINGNKAVMANLPNKRQPEEAYAEEILRKRGFEVVKLPADIHFSGQGDALPCGKYLFVGSDYRTSHEAHPLLARELNLEVIGLTTIPQMDADRKAIINPVTEWPDSFFYDLDLALAVIDEQTIIWCPEAFIPESQERIHAITDLEKIEVSLEEAMNGFACNLVSTGESVIMSSYAPVLKSILEAKGLKIYTPDVTELLKGGGFIRCTSLTLD
ncbi:MAG: N-dimethylarginine dimethylaminohydrolase [Candidatus Saccharimonadales bacterium]|jgi:N-dimethylarginine dimethylaminohydrolase